MSKFIVLEGIDGSGKSSVAEYLGGRFERVYITQEPSDSKPGILAQNIDDEETSPYLDLFLYLADRVEHTEDIRKRLDGGFDVICDRYWGSTAAYQSAHEEIDLKYAVDIQRPFVLEPSVTFLLDLDPEISLKRISSRQRKSKYERLDFLRKERKNYIKIAEDHHWTIIDADQDIAQVKKEIREGFPD